MAFKQFQLDDQTVISVYKRKGSRSLRLSVTAKGEIRVSIPTWVPYGSGLAFARSRMAWIQAQQKPVSLLQQGQPVGKAHHLVFAENPKADRPTTRIRGSEIVIGLPIGMTFDNPIAQKSAESACIRALKVQATLLLPQRLQSLAEQFGFTYKSVSIKQLKSRWGSCDHEQNIVFNLFLMQLPWECVDYVILHELTHTRILKHGPEFWAAMKQVLPEVQQRRKAMRGYQPILHSPDATAVA